MSDLKGKVAVVTGASKGIGAAIAKGLSVAGAAVVVNYSSSKEGADRVVADINANGGKAIAVKGDVAKAADMRRLFDETEKAFGTLDVLVNNAGVYKFLPLEDITEDEFHREFNINVLGTILATKEAVKHFGPNGGTYKGRELPHAPRTEPYGPNSGIRLPPWVSDCKARIWPGVKDARFWEPVVGQPRGPFPDRPVLLTSPPQRASP